MILTERLNEPPENGARRRQKRTLGVFGEISSGRQMEKQIKATMRQELLFTHTRTRRADTHAHTHAKYRTGSRIKGKQQHGAVLAPWLPDFFLSRLLSRSHLSRSCFPWRRSSAELNHLTRPGLSWTAAVVEEWWDGRVWGGGYERNENKAEWRR